MNLKKVMALYRLILIVLGLCLFSSKLVADVPKSYSYLKLTVSDIYHPFLSEINQKEWRSALLDTLVLKDVEYTDRRQNQLETESFPIVFRDETTVIFQIPVDKTEIDGPPLRAAILNYSKDNFKSFYSLPMFTEHVVSCSDVSRTVVLYMGSSSMGIPIVDGCTVTPVMYLFQYEINDDIKQLVKKQDIQIFSNENKYKMTSDAYERLFTLFYPGYGYPKRITIDENTKGWSKLIYIPDSFYANYLKDEIENLSKNNVILSEKFSIAGFTLHSLNGSATGSEAQRAHMVSLLNSNNKFQSIGNNIELAFQYGAFITYQENVIGFEIRTECGRRLRGVKLDITDTSTWKITDDIENAGAANMNKNACKRIFDNMDFYTKLTPKVLDQHLNELVTSIEIMRSERPIMPEYQWGNDVVIGD
ncbi:hypothetical protein [Thorsellia anophelis]|uniref:Uncharacterized protein n=1 Tax=Thorsellia anophelis DSM 18579 TaxID=1123402 RepID=A0A1I0B2N7_9GAMM|nr:hypothetical protein [Thorsellia anophelis]SET00338.1 hypothetical protein SAMN02583745_01095 [Thorsellia anophelis DSM 18579]